MYDRRLDGRVMRFGHAGMLVNDSFVMYDHQTDSLWVHVTGQAFHGPLKGKKLKFMPSTVTTWAQWKAGHPNTTVLPGLRREGSVMGTYMGMTKPANLGLAVLVNWEAKLYPLAALAEHPVVNDLFNGEAVLAFYATNSGAALAWSRRLGGRVLRFEMADASDRFGNRLVRDRETGSIWSGLTGEAISGPLQGRLLNQLIYNPILTDRFKVFYKNAPIFEPLGK